MLWTILIPLSTLIFTAWAVSLLIVEEKKSKIISIYRVDSFSYYVGVQTGDDVQYYRGSGKVWRLYPQGTDLDSLSPLATQLDVYVQQFEWSLEHKNA